MKTLAPTTPRAMVLAATLTLAASLPATALAQAEGSGVVSPNPVVSPTGTTTVQQAAPRNGAAPGTRSGRIGAPTRLGRRRAGAQASTMTSAAGSPPSARADARNQEPMPTVRDPGAGLGASAPR